MHASTIHVIVTGVHYKAPKQQPMPCILCRVKGWYFEGWGGSKMVSCASRLPQLALLFCIKLLRNIHLGVATVINLTAGGPSMCRQEGIHILHCPSNVQILTVLVFPVVRCLQNFKLSSFFDHFLWLWLKRQIHGFDKRGSFMFDPEQIYLHFSSVFCQSTHWD